MDPTDADNAGTPLWVKIAGVVTLAVVALALVLLLTGRGGSHGPGRHTSDGDTRGGHTGPPPGITHQQP